MYHTGSHTKHYLVKMYVCMLMAQCAVGVIKPASHNIVIWVMCQQLKILEAVLRNPEYYQTEDGARLFFGSRCVCYKRKCE